VADERGSADAVAVRSSLVGRGIDQAVDRRAGESVQISQSGEAARDRLRILAVGGGLRRGRSTMVVRMSMMARFDRRARGGSWARAAGEMAATVICFLKRACPGCDVRS